MTKRESEIENPKSSWGGGSQSLTVAMIVGIAACLFGAGQIQVTTPSVVPAAEHGCPN